MNHLAHVLQVCVAAGEEEQREGGMEESPFLPPPLGLSLFFYHIESYLSISPLSASLSHSDTLTHARTH